MLTPLIVVTATLVLLGLGLAGYGASELHAGLVGLPATASTAETSTNLISFARAFLGLGWLIGACFCGILARIAQAAASNIATIEAIRGIVGERADAESIDDEEAREREVARLMERARTV